MGRIEGTNFRLINELFLWSPKGPFTGSVAAPNSVAAAWSFERNDANCGRPNCDETVTAGGAQFGRNRVLVRQADLVYYIAPNISVLLAVLWNDAANVPTNQQVAIGCSKNADTRAGKGCDWVDSVLRFRWYF